ncbi:hypothetical protein TKK_0019287 [Trichogramma kaykai]|uniref:alpha-glucosidase n=1 Tax=Trichogramma kaykai TaxID=54128 RepID=A0ABD2VTA8_9HYME
MWCVHLLSVCLLAHIVKSCEVQIDETRQDIHWWKTSVIYQIYPRSFKDSNGDGIGDLNGITSKLEHIKDAGADALWLSPIYKSPQKDFGYDISDFRDIDPTYGTLADFDGLVAKAKSLKLKVLLDFVPNHSSDEHEWFKKSEQRIDPYTNYYVWADGKNNNPSIPPNNWLSNFGGSAWKWSETRKQYYYHAFVDGQPDLNYRDEKLRQEMEDILTFWMKRGVDGFRVDAINQMFETTDLKDEPISGKTDDPNDYDYLIHNQTRDLNETYDVVSSWQKLIDNHVRNYRTDGKLMILEAYTTIPRSMMYYDVGSNPFNFMFVATLNNQSTPEHFKKTIDTWLNAVPEGKVSNWVSGNHDNHRVATRFGENGRADQIPMLCSMLPGIMVIYNGDEIGMVDRDFSFEETVDPAGCNAGEEKYEDKSRDPERTPYQWDSTTSAGFSSNPNTWLPVHQNYVTLNLAAQKNAVNSHYKVFQALTKLKKTPVLLKGKTELFIINNQVLAVVRRLKGEKSVVLLINFNNDQPLTLDVKAHINISDNVTVYTSSVESGFKVNDTLDANNLVLPKRASLIIFSDI